MNELRTAVCCIVKNEPIYYLKEFIYHHLSIGFDKIFIYDNNDIDNTYSDLEKEFSDKLDIITFKGKCKQFDAYIDCTNKNKDSYDWIAYIDSDEFIEVERNSIKDILRDIDAPALGLNWQMFGTGKYNGVSQIDSFINAHNMLYAPNKHVKVIARPEEITNIDNPHNFSFRNGRKAVTITGEEIETFFTSTPINRIAWINHYYCRTEKDKKNKLIRGRADSETTYNKYIFKDMDNNTYKEMRSIEIEKQRNKRIALITPTGNRKFQIELCFKYMKRQNFTGKVDWYIIDDCYPFTSDFIRESINRANWNIHIFHPKPYWKEGDNTQGRNLILGLNSIHNSNIEYDGIFFIEDDDWYSPDYLFEMTKKIDGYDITGTQRALYWNVPDNITQRCNNLKHSSLCQTVINPSMIDMMKIVCYKGNRFFDMDLWKIANIKNKKMNIFTASPDICIGIKGLSGRKGIGGFHEIKRINPLVRIGNENICAIIGEKDYNIYEDKFHNGI